MIELVTETLSSKIYKVLEIEDEIALIIPKTLPDKEAQTQGFLDLIFETQLQQFLNGTEKSTHFPEVHEEIFLINSETKTILNYMTIVEYPNLSLISMTAGPQAKSNE